MTDVTQILDAIERGDPQAASQLFPLVYNELRGLAARKLALEPRSQSFAATDLVHEAFLKLVGSEKGRGWESLGRFFGAASEAMRRILVDKARRRRSQKRDSRSRQRVGESQLVAPGVSDDLLAVDQALTQLSSVNAQAAELVKLRYFSGFSIPDAARILNIGPRSANRLWAYARAWLHDAIYREGNG